MRRKLFVLLAALLSTCVMGSTACGEAYYYPPEDGEHEGTWLIWPHDIDIDLSYYELPDHFVSYRDSIESVWVAITSALHTGEIVHIIAHDETERAHIQALLEAENVDMRQIDFFLYKTNDVWARDTGPIFVLDEDGRVVIANFKFDGWGGKQPYARDDGIPQAVADAYGFDIIQIPDMVLEGGSIDCDGAGTLLAAKSSVVSPNRNAGKSLEDVEAILSQTLGVSNFIWIKGALGEDITDAHIDGTARFVNDHQILICSKEEYAMLYLTNDVEGDWAVFESAVNARGEPYELVHLPLSQNMVTAYGKRLRFYGSYTNYYVGNEVVLVPQYNDPNDAAALEIIGRCYPGRRVVGIDCSKLIYFGGMIHCITQQQPMPQVR